MVETPEIYIKEKCAMKKKNIEKEIEKRLISIISDGAEINSFVIAYKKKATKKEWRKFQNKICEKYEDFFESVFDCDFDD
jgi:hypothetical protein